MLLNAVATISQVLRMLSLLFLPLSRGVAPKVEDVVIVTDLQRCDSSSRKCCLRCFWPFSKVWLQQWKMLCVSQAFKGEIVKVNDIICVIAGLVWRCGDNRGEWRQESSLHHTTGLHQRAGRGHTAAEELKVRLRTSGPGTWSNQVSLWISTVMLWGGVCVWVKWRCQV